MMTGTPGGRRFAPDLRHGAAEQTAATTCGAIAWPARVERPVALVDVDEMGRQPHDSRRCGRDSEGRIGAIDPTAAPQHASSAPRSRPCRRSQDEAGGASSAAVARSGAPSTDRDWYRCSSRRCRRGGRRRSADGSDGRRTDRSREFRRCERALVFEFHAMRKAQFGVRSRSSDVRNRTHMLMRDLRQRIDTNRIVPVASR